MIKVSVVTPTYDRERFLPAFYRMFCAQDYPSLELLVADDSPVPSPLFSSLDDQRVRYVHLPSRMSIGEKRNRMIDAATGEIIVSFDDDDYYAPAYISGMVRALGDADMVKLVGWYVHAVAENATFYWDTEVNHAAHFKVGNGPTTLVSAQRFVPDFVEKNVDGYGFSYVLRRSIFETMRFPDQNFGEDLALARLLRERGGRIVHIQDARQSVIHMMHGRTTSMVFPQYRLPPGLVSQLFPGLAEHLACVDTHG
jgi:glycosyltransferase involved in cell wall biosynthesis